MNTQLTRTVRLLSLAALLAALLASPGTAQHDTQSSLTRGHLALDRGQYHAALEQFRLAAALAADTRAEKAQAEALYWQAFALYRLGNKRELNEAAETLLQLRTLEMEKRLQHEAQALAARVKSDLAQQGDARAARELAVMAEEQGAIEEKLIALQALMNMNPERALPILEQVLARREPGSAELRRQAVFLLGQGEADGAEALMIDIARNDPDSDVRAQAVFWLGQAGSDESLAFFRELISSEQDPELLQQAVFALSQHGGDEANAALRELAADPTRSIEVRQHAIFGLGQGGDQDDRDFLRDLYYRLENIELKQHILHSAAQNDDHGTGAWLLAIALNPEEDMESRTMAIFWAGQQGQLPVSRLDEIYATVDDSQMREQIIFVLAQDGSSEAMQKLMTIARQEDDLELRKQAIFWIGQSGAEGAEDFLLEIINQ